MYDEAVSFFEHIVRRDRPVNEILFADYTFLNKPLAKFYGIERDVTSTDERDAGGRRPRVRPRRRASSGGRADRDVGAAANQPRQARRLGAASCARHADAAAAGRRRLDAGRREIVRRPDPAGAAGRAQARRTLRVLSPADRSDGLSRSSASTPSGAGATRTRTGSRSTLPRSSPTRARSPALRACWNTCRPARSRC